MEAVLKDKRILLVDDEPDILDTLEETLDMCMVDKATSFEEACRLLAKNAYDAAILDIMGVRGYELLDLTMAKGVPALMLTAFALSPDNLVKSLKAGAQYYVPKYKIDEMTLYLADIILAKQKGLNRQATWFMRLKPYFDKQFGPGWRAKHKEFWAEFDRTHNIVFEEET